MSLAAVLAVAVVLLVLGVVLRKRSGPTHAASLAAVMLVGVGALGIAGVVVEFVMFFLNP